MGAGGGGAREPGVIKKDSLGRSVIGQGAVVEAAGLPAYYEPMEGENKFRTEKLDKAWRADTSIAGGGVIIDGGSHTIRPMRMLMQPHCGAYSTLDIVHITCMSQTCMSDFCIRMLTP